jgi:acetyl-CoA carboxylase biotin carboxyl carrier protein
MSDDNNTGRDGKTGDLGMNIDGTLVRELAELLAETNLTEIEVADGDRKIRVVRGAPQMVAAAPVAYAPAPAAAAPVAAAPPLPPSPPSTARP